MKLLLCVTLAWFASIAQQDEDLVKRAAATREEYIRDFRDLTATETWVTELLRADGSVARHRTIVSDFFVYQSKFDTRKTYEYRITHMVDGKAEADAVKQATKLFRALGNARTYPDEEDAINQQNFAHVLRFIHLGLTTGPVWALAEKQRNDFHFTRSKPEGAAAADTLGLSYESKTFQPREATSVLQTFKNPRTGVRGTVWLDPKTGAFQRWVDDMLVLDDHITTPAVVIHRDITYTSTALGVFPAHVAVSTFEKARDKKSRPVLRPLIRQTYTYEAFKRFDVATATEIKTPEPR